MDPPESDPGVIEGAIKKKQAEWSRQRNHPTKALEAKQYIGMIPEIRKVMTDPDSRLKEAREAVKYLENQEEKKFSEVDRHISICMSKGYITKEEIVKLAKLHSIQEIQIRKRIKKQEEKKIAEIDKNLSIRMRKGFITAKEISDLAELYSVSEDEIRKRVTCPIRNQSLKKIEKTKSLDPTIEKLITDNLKIVGKSSLYEFLGLPENSNLEILQKRAQEKKAEIQKINKKDAVVTAGGALIGYCISIFKSDAARSSYDVSRVHSYLAKLNSDIDVAAMHGKIRAEYLDILVERAMGFGMTRKEAAAYLKEYCRKKKWEIESPKKKKKYPPLAIAAAVVIMIAAVASGSFFYVKKMQRLKKEYQLMLSNVDSQSELEEKQKILNHYIKTHDDNEYTLLAESKIQELQKLIVERAFEESLRQADSTLNSNDLEKAALIYEQFLAQYPSSIYAQKIKQKQSALLQLIDDKNFQQLNEVIVAAPSDKIKVYQQFLENHPTSRHRDKVRKLIDEMHEEYYLFLKKKIAAYQAQEEWTRCVILCDQFLAIYPKHKRTPELTELRLVFNEKARYQKIMKNLTRLAKSKGTDYQAARQVYADYLAAYPGSFIADQVKQEMSKLDALVQSHKLESYKKTVRSRLKNFAGRFSENKDGVITDKKTGLMWCLLDSREYVGKCMDYESAVQYVKDLKTGGYEDWRFPTAAELETLYKKQPAFPEGPVEEAVWYWTAQSYVRYAGGWGKLIEVLSLQGGSGWKHEKKETWECGAIRAVRP